MLGVKVRLRLGVYASFIPHPSSPSPCRVMKLPIHHPDSDWPSNIKTESWCRHTTMPFETQLSHASRGIPNAVSNSKKYERGIEALSTPRCELVRQVLETSQRSRLRSLLRSLDTLGLLDLSMESNELVD